MQKAPTCVYTEADRDTKELYNELAKYFERAAKTNPVPRDVAKTYRQKANDLK